MAESIKYIGASTHDLDLFEGQYSIPRLLQTSGLKILKKRLTAESLNILWYST